MQFHTKKISKIAILSAVAIVLQGLENIIIITPIIPGGKVGLANIVTIVSMQLFGFVPTFILVIIRTLIGSLLFGGLSSFIYSFAGAVFALIFMSLSKNIKGITYIGIGIIGAFTNNLGQVLVSCLILKNISIISYIATLGIISIFTGAIIGLISTYVLNSLEKRGNF